MPKPAGSSLSAPAAGTAYRPPARNTMSRTTPAASSAAESPILPEIRESRTEEKAAASRDARLFPPLLIRRFLRQVFCSRRPVFPPLFFLPSASGLLSFTLCLFSLPAVAAVFCPFSSINFCPIASMPVAFGLRLFTLFRLCLIFQPFRPSLCLLSFRPSVFPALFRPLSMPLSFTFAST